MGSVQDTIPSVQGLLRISNGGSPKQGSKHFTAFPFFVSPPPFQLLAVLPPDPDTSSLCLNRSEGPVSSLLDSKSGEADPFIHLLYRLRRSPYWTRIQVVLESLIWFCCHSFSPYLASLSHQPLGKQPLYPIRWAVISSSFNCSWCGNW